MARILVIHYDKSIRSNLEALANGHHVMGSAENLNAGIRQMARLWPDAIVVGQDRKKQEGIRLLRYMRDNQLKAPVVVVASADSGALQPMAMKLEFTATVDGDKISGNVSLGSFGSATLEGTRA